MNTRKILSVILSLVMVITALPLTAVSSFAEMSGDFEYEILDDGTAEITKYNGSATELEIPEVIDGHKVVEIGGAFDDCESLTSLTIPKSVNKIYIYTFEFDSIECINVSEENEKYSSKDGVLFSKDQTVLIKYPRGKKDLSYRVPDGVEAIDAIAFQYCIFLTDVTLPDSVKTIKHHAFNSSTALKSISLPDSIESIECLAFNYTAYFQNKDNWEDGILYIGNHLITTDYFLEIEGEKEEYVETYPSDYVVKDGTVTIADYAFSYDTLWWCFYYNRHLKSIVLPDSVKNVGYGVFAECIELKSVKLSSGLTKIGFDSDFEDDWLWAFGLSACPYLESIEIPENITKIEDNTLGYWVWEGDEGKIDDLVIYGYEGSEAERYANDNGFTFIALEKEPIVDPIPDDPTPTPDDPTPAPETAADINGDGKLSVVDAKWLLQAVANSRDLTDEQRALADVNGDGKLSVVDAKWILQAVAGMREL